MRPSYGFVWRTVGLWKSWSKYSRQAGTIGLVCLPFMNFWLLIDMCRHRAVWRAMEDQPIGRDVLRCPMGCGLKDFTPFSWLTCARRNHWRNTVSKCEMLSIQFRAVATGSGAGSNLGCPWRSTRWLRFGWCLADCMVFLMLFQCFFLRIKFKFTWPKACWSHSRTRVLELSLTCPRKWSSLHATDATGFCWGVEKPKKDMETLKQLGDEVWETVSWLGWVVYTGHRPMRKLSKIIRPAVMR